MARGGKRLGSGRPKGAANKKTREIAEAVVKEGITPLEYFMKILRDEAMPSDARFAAAKEAAPYIHPRLQAVQHSGDEDAPLRMEIAWGASKSSGS